MYRFLMMLFMVCVSMTASAQKAKITGTVRDLGGEPLIGVSVRAVSYTHLTLPTICSV